MQQRRQRSGGTAIGEDDAGGGAASDSGSTASKGRARMMTQLAQLAQDPASTFAGSARSASKSGDMDLMPPPQAPTRTSALA